MFRYFYLAVSLLMLMMSFTEPTTKWPIDAELFGLPLKGDIYSFLFGICTVLYIPMMGVALYYFVKGTLESIKTKIIKLGFLHFQLQLLVSPHFIASTIGYSMRFSNNTQEQTTIPRRAMAVQISAYPFISLINSRAKEN